MLLLLWQMLIICSHPLSLVLVPVWAVKLYRERTPFARVVQAVLIVTALVYFWQGVQHRSYPMLTAEMARRTGYLLAVRVFLEALVEARIPTQLQEAGRQWLNVTLGAGALAAVVTLAAVFRRRFERGQLWVLAVLLYAIVSLTFLSVVTRLLPAAASRWAQRYFYLQHFLFLLGATTSKDFADMEGDRRAGCSTIPVRYGVRRAAWLSAPFFIVPWILFPLGTWLRRAGGRPVLSGNAALLGILGATLFFYGIYVVYLMVRRPEALATQGENHPSWTHMYRMMMVAQVGIAVAYLV